MANWIQISCNLIDADTANQETRNLIFFLALTYSVQMTGEYLSRIQKPTRNRYPEIDWEGWIGYRLLAAHKIEETDIDRLTKECEEAAPLLLYHLEIALNGKDN